MDNKIMFIGMDISKEIKFFLDSKESLITNGMTDTEIKAYKLGISNTLSALSSIHNSYDNEIIVNINDIEDTQELDLEDLIKKLNK